MMDKDDILSSDSEDEEDDDDDDAGKNSKSDAKMKGWFSSMFQRIDFVLLEIVKLTAMEEALVRILTPRHYIGNILRDVHAAKEQRKPYIVVFVGVGVAYWLLEHDVKVMIAACDTFRSGAVEQLRTHARRLEVGVIFGNLGYVRDLFTEFNKTFGFIIDFGMMGYMFALGVEMDPYVLLQKPPRHVRVAYSGVGITFMLAAIVSPFNRFFPHLQRLLEYTTALSILLASTDSPALTRLLTQLKIGKSDIGKLVIASAMHSDFVCYCVLSVGYMFSPLPELCDDLNKPYLSKTSKMGLAVLGEVLFTLMFSPFFMSWVDEENPDGRPMKGPHLILSIAFVVLMCSSSVLAGFTPILSAFLVGVCFPREADLSQFEATRYRTWINIVVLITVSITGKISGALVSGAVQGFHWPEATAIGLLLTTKGHVHIYLAVKVMNCVATSKSNGIGMIIAIFFTVIYTPSVVAQIIRRAKKRVPTRHMVIQSLDPLSELRILLCVHGPHNAPASINFAEISKGAADPGILVYVTDMIELTNDISPTLETEEGLHTTTVKDREILDMREKITNAFQAHILDSGEGITLKRTLALSTITNMPHDICVLAEDMMVALVVLPFHRVQRQDGTLDGGNQGFRYVNRKVLRSAPCSVGILVDRGLGSFERLSRSQTKMNVAVIFIGGKDDREALAYASRVSQHPGVKLSVLRFLVDTSAESSRLAGYRIILPDQEKEMQLDDECFAEFYEKHVIGGKIAYAEKHLANAAETFSILKSFEGQYSLVILGREGGINSILTRGMNDWQQCPELGPIGDVLSGPDFSRTISVLIIQQHKVTGQIDGLDDDFSIMSYNKYG
ncbi:cation H(+) antiporter 28-like protein [Trifolium pratense]|uniref:Cation H(+) antiporter 28-like protein n=1 Tax=Trifolium pratense TaxID=57577 RepID=A0A2K3NLG8_TRIPR|nr:cation H(+) antiporter 28-like protein [Trifolium pratense]